MGDLTGRTAFVTGGGRGIGRAISLALAAAGANVGINYARKQEEAAATAEEIRGLGRNGAIYQANLAEYEECEAMVQRALDDLGPIDILVNNAGIASRGQTVADTDPAEMMRVVATHAFGSFYMSKLLVPQMRERDRADVVMISSGAAQSLGARGAPYNMAKAAQEAVAYTLAKEERRHGIRVNVVAPGLVETEMGLRLMRANTGISDMREIDERMPFGFVCQPEDIASAVLFLVSESGRYITNQRITVNGGGF